MASANPPTRAPFTTNPEEFDADNRISFSRVSQKFLLETEDGEEFEWEDVLKRWVPVVDDALLEEQRKAYGGADGGDEETTAGKKRKNGGDADGHRAKKKKDKNEGRERKNTAVYITNIPFDADMEEVQHVFSKCGVIAEEIDSGRPRIRMYTDDQGNFKGDALIVYFRAESVELAIQMLDDTDFRLGTGLPAGRMKVAAADFSYKRQKDEGEGEKEGGEKKKDRERQKIIKKTQKLNSKLADWDDDDPQQIADTSSRWDKVVILTHMFTLAELDVSSPVLFETAFLLRC